jgi:hypothetical protein
MNREKALDVFPQHRDEQMGQYIKLNRLEFVVTWRCNSQCKHCSVVGNRTKKPVVISSELAVKIVKQITDVYSITSIMTFGGEPLLFPEVVSNIHQAAVTAGIAKREIITNAGWSCSANEAHSLALKLVESGVTNIAVSVDAFHQEHIPVDLVKRNVKSLIDTGLRVVWNPCWVVSQTHNNPWNKRTIEILDDLSSLGITVSEGNVVQPSGNALHWLADFMPLRSFHPEGKCEDVPYAEKLDNITCISVEPDGSIMICKELPLGNAAEQNVLDLLENFDPNNNPETAAILQGGTSKFADYARQKGILPNIQGYFTICDKCVDLRRKLSRISPH